MLNSILKEIAPSKSEIIEVKAIVDEFIKKLPRNTFVGGSYAKGTWLKGIKDVDLFVRFEKDNDISEKLAKILSKFKLITRVHGSRDYFQVEFKGITFEVVPIVEIKKANDSKNITDISPLHVKWVNKNSNTKIKEGIMLLKALLKANNLYGAESYIRGFSGYVCEILVCYYGGFLELLKEASKWKSRQLIDPNKVYQNATEAALSLNTSKLGPLLLIDPVQDSRNTAAALTKENFDKFVKLAKEFGPNKEFFVEEIKKKSDLSKLGVWLDVTPLDAKVDIAGAKMVCVFNYIVRESKRYGFKLIDKGWYWKKNASFWFEFEGELPKEYKIRGPPITAKTHVEAFKKAHKGCQIKGNYIVAQETREFINPQKFIKALIKSDYVTPRVRQIK